MILLKVMAYKLQPLNMEVYMSTKLAAPELLSKPLKKAEKSSFVLTSKTFMYMDFYLLSTRIEKNDQDLVFHFKDLSSIHLHSFYDYYTAEEVPFFILNASSHHTYDSLHWHGLYSSHRSHECHSSRSSRKSRNTHNFLEAWGLSHKNPCFDASHEIDAWFDSRI